MWTLSSFQWYECSSISTHDSSSHVGKKAQHFTSLEPHCAPVMSGSFCGNHHFQYPDCAPAGAEKHWPRLWPRLVTARSESTLSVAKRPRDRWRLSSVPAAACLTRPLERAWRFSAPGAAGGGRAGGATARARCGTGRERPLQPRSPLCQGRVPQ